MIRIDAEKLKRYNVSDKSTGIYFLFNKNKVVYVGMSQTHLERRITTHLYHNSINFDSYALLPLKLSLSDLLFIEAAFIEKYMPKYNSDRYKRPLTYKLTKNKNPYLKTNPYLKNIVINRKSLLETF